MLSVTDIGRVEFVQRSSRIVASANIPGMGLLSWSLVQAIWQYQDLIAAAMQPVVDRNSVGGKEIRWRRPLTPVGPK